LFTVTPPVTLALIRFGNPVPGSKNPEPEDEVPVIVTLTELDPRGTPELADVGVAGGGAMSLTTSTPYVPVPSGPAPSQNSWTVHMVMSSLGSTLVKE
jgi:hypothetical protein